MDLMLQLWSGLFDLFNKIFFALAERQGEKTKRLLRVCGWSAYLAGVPAWVVLLAGKHNWMAASIEIGGVPAMLYGLYNALNGPQPAHTGFDRCVTCSTYSFLIFGIGCSCYDFGGIHTLSQLLEIVMVASYLAGGYSLARNNLYGWPLFMLMSASTSLLMFLQDQSFLAFQQLLSLGFVSYGFSLALKALRGKCL